MNTMDPVTVTLIAFALSLDAFAVALTAGAVLVKASRRQMFRLSFHFGFFQFMMPIIGWFAGVQVESLVSSFDHWIAMALLAFVGGKMIYESFENHEEVSHTDMTKGWSLVSLSIATSIDALAVGFSLAVMNSGIVGPSIVIGLVASGMTLLGISLGQKFSEVLGKRMEFIGGLVLTGIGIRIVLEHMKVF
jgi:putative Mn2+ efflux pump MntP